MDEEGRSEVRGDAGGEDAGTAAELSDVRGRLQAAEVQQLERGRQQRGAVLKARDN